MLDPDVLTIGFARRVPTYKRLTLMLSDKERLKRLLLHPERPIQLVIAGKSHPADETGKRLIQEMVRFADDPEIRHRIVFLPNYDIAMAQHLYPGCDVWLNNPLRPFEACGTSGMKAALNGGLNLSILDGWWDEWFDGRNGWAIPTADGIADPDRRDDLEASALYDLIEHNVAASFYERDEAGLPHTWISMITHTLATLGPKVLASRMVQDYTEQLYSPAAAAGRALNGPDFKGARELAAYKARVRAAWPNVRVDHVEPSGLSDSPQIGDTLHVSAYVDLGGLSPEDVEVQLVHGRVSDADDHARYGRGAAGPRRGLRQRDLPVRGRAEPHAHRVLRLQHPGRAQTPRARVGRGARPGSQRLTPVGSQVGSWTLHRRIDDGDSVTSVPAGTLGPGGVGRSCALSHNKSYAAELGALGSLTSAAQALPLTWSRTER